MKIKKEIIILIGIIIVIIIAILINLKINNKQPLSNTPKTLQILLKEYYEKANTVDSSEKLKLLQELKEKTLQELNDTLYYKSFNTYDSILDDIRTIFICNENEIYILPFSQLELKEKNISIGNIAEMENSELYKYKLTEISTAKSTEQRVDMNTGNILNEKGLSVNEGIYITLESQYINAITDTASYSKFKQINIDYYIYDNFYWFDGYFADQTNEIGKYNFNNTIGISSLRKYYKDEKDAVRQREKKKAEYEKKQTEQEEQRKKDLELSKKIPEPGMTASEVRKTLWGEPDKINKDTYSWGTTEQWVYYNYGYVYLKNGSVTAVSQR